VQLGIEKGTGEFYLLQCIYKAVTMWKSLCKGWIAVGMAMLLLIQQGIPDIDDLSEPLHGNCYSRHYEHERAAVVWTVPLI